MSNQLSLLLPQQRKVSLMQPQSQHRHLLNRLSLEQLEEALLCLHQDLPPQDSYLQNLPWQDWNLLHELLIMLIVEKKESSVH